MHSNPIPDGILQELCELTPRNDKDAFGGLETKSSSSSGQPKNRSMNLNPMQTLEGRPEIIGTNSSS
jgi:hypothetical protein